MAGLTDRDLRRIKRFVETPPRQRTPHILTPDADEPSEGRLAATDEDGDGGTDHDAGTAR
jgi:hypothetical protein